MKVLYAVVVVDVRVYGFFKSFLADPHRVQNVL